MRKMLFIAACALITGAAGAADDVMANFYGNTVVGTGGLAETHTYFKPDHTFEMKAPAFGVAFAGTWSLEGDKLCRTFETLPPGVTNPLCSPIAAHKIGDVWTVDMNDQTITLTLVEGQK